MSQPRQQQSSSKSAKSRVSLENKVIKANGEVGIFVKTKDIKLSKKQPRRYFNPAKLQQLTESIKQYGILEPLILRPLTAKTYELVAGERRYRAAKEAGLTEVPVIIRDLDEQQAFELALLENLQRDDLNPIDETEGLLELLCQSLGCTREDVISLLNQAANAKRRDQPLTNDVTRQIEIIDNLFLTVGRLNRESFRTNRLPLLNLPEDVLDVLRQGELEYTKAKAIAKLADEGQRKELMQQTINERLSLSELKQKIKRLLNNQQEHSPGAQKDLWAELNAITRTKSDAWDDERKQPKIKALLSELKKVLGV